MTIEISDLGAVRKVIFNDPATRNAITASDIATLTRAMSERSGDVKIVVFEGVGQCFSSGLHLDTFANLDEEGAQAVISQLGEALRAIRQKEIPTLAVIDGPCMGAALELVAACDIRIGTVRAKVGMPEIRLGFPSVLDAPLLLQYFGLSMAKELMLAGLPLEYERWAPTSFFNRVVDPGDLARESDAMVAWLTGLPQGAYAAQKRLFDVWQNQHLDASIKASISEFSSSFALTS